MSDQVRSVIPEFKGLNSPDPVRKARGSTSISQITPSGHLAFLFFFLEIVAPFGLPAVPQRPLARRQNISGIST